MRVELLTSPSASFPEERLETAAFEGNYTIVHRQVCYVINNQDTIDRATMIAAEKGHLDCFRTLHPKSKVPHRTLAELAEANEHWDIFRYLLTFNTDALQEMALKATREGRTESLDIILENLPGGKLELALEAIKADTPDCFDRISAHLLPLSSDSVNALMNAIGDQEDPEWIEKVLDFITENYDGMITHHWIAAKFAADGNIPCLQTLRFYGFQYEWVVQDAARNGRLACLKELLNGAHLPDGQRIVAIMEAARSHHFDCCQILLASHDIIDLLLPERNLEKLAKLAKEHDAERTILKGQSTSSRLKYCVFTNNLPLLQQEVKEADSTQASAALKIAIWHNQPEMVKALLSTEDQYDLEFIANTIKEARFYPESQAILRNYFLQLSQ